MDILCAISGCNIPENTINKRRLGYIMCDKNNEQLHAWNGLHHAFTVCDNYHSCKQLCAWGELNLHHITSLSKCLIGWTVEYNGSYNELLLCENCAIIICTNLLMYRIVDFSQCGIIIHGVWDLWSITTWLWGRSPRTRVVNPRLLCIMCYILQPDWSLLILVNMQDSLHCKQGMLLVNIQNSLHFYSI